MASSIWQKLFKADPFDSDMGALFRRECLSYGGGKPSSTIISDLLNNGHPVDHSKLADNLLNEIDEKQKSVKEFS